jgi:hypothetical protein
VGNAYTILVLKPEGKSPSERFNLEWEGNIKTGLRGIDW